VALTVSLPGTALALSTDRQQWQPLPAEAKDGWVTVTLPPAPTPAPRYLRLTR
jgi:hypothetical protein